MDCVGCDKCRLWGKLQTAGYGTALKVLFEFDKNDRSHNPPLRRTELVALFNTLDKLSHSLSALAKFEALLHPEGLTQSQRQKAARKAIVDEDLMDDDAVPPRRRVHGETTMEAIWAELDLMWRTFRWVLRSWMNLPRNL